MSRQVGRGLVVGGALGVAAVVSVLWPSVFVGAGLVAMLVWQITRCRHSQPLGLLPPIVNERGETVPPRWYCDDCGKSWPAVFEHGPGPVQRFSGYDQSKATAAAKRADELADRTRALALKRAGVNPMSQPSLLTKTRATAAPPLKPVPLHGRRIAG
jgi:hypothetical protein